MRAELTTIALTLLCTVATAQTTYNIVDTNQSLFFDNSSTIKMPKKGAAFYGQDAQFERNSPSYTDNGDGTITDNVTGLVWQKEFSVMSYDEAMAAAKSCTLGGKSDWRLPSIKEAYSLIDFSGVDASNRDMYSVPEGAVPFINTNYFDFEYGANGSRKIDTQMLSSTTYVGNVNSRLKLVFGVNLADGRIKGYPMTTRNEAKKFSVRFVRGVEYGVNKFVSNKNKTISDTATGLMWQRDDSGKGLDWEDALKYAEAMNKKRYMGYSDWRVPNAKELQSIVDYTRSPETTASAAIDPIFKTSQIKNELGEVDYPFYWSSTTHCSAGIRSSGGAAAAYVSFGRGLGNMQQMGGQQGGMGGGNRGGGMGGGMNDRPARNNSSNMVDGNGINQQMNYGERQQMDRNSGGGAMQSRSQGMQQGGYGGGKSSVENWTNIHGAGCQRSDPKSGDEAEYQGGRGPQGDAIRIKNYVRLVRDI
ncbi:MAG: DUF1566 domain-containing protein [Rikenellaceae bacterium]